MTEQKLRAFVGRAALDPTDKTPWIAAAIFTHMTPAGSNTITSSAYVESWPEAMLQAYKLMHDLDRHLMDQVHESRARRRETKTKATPDAEHLEQLNRITLALLRLQPSPRRDELIESLVDAIKDPELDRVEARLLISAASTILDQLQQREGAAA